MELQTEIVEEKQNALIVSKKEYAFISLLKSELKRVSISPFSSPFIPKNIKMFHFIFVIDESVNLEKIKKNKESFFIYIFLGLRKQQTDIKNPPKNIKIITVNGNLLEKKEIDKILWFSISKSDETSLNLNLSQIVKEKFNPVSHIADGYKRFVTKKNLILSSFLFIVFLHLAFIPFLFLSLFFNYQNYIALKKNSFKDINNSAPINEISKKLYSIVRPSYLLFGIAILPDNLIDINEKGLMIVRQTESLLENFRGLGDLFFQLQKSAEQKNILVLRIEKAKINLANIQEELNIIAQKIPMSNNYFEPIKKQLLELADNLQKGKKIISYFQDIVTEKKPKKYVVFFANNMELRPGGGFIGSFGVFEIGDYNIGNIKVYDIYDADAKTNCPISKRSPLVF